FQPNFDAEAYNIVHALSLLKTSAKLRELTEGNTISEVEFQLNNESKHTTITTMSVLSRNKSITQRIRIDSLFSLIFEENEEIIYSEMKNLAVFNFPADLNEFSMNISVPLGREIATPSIAVIHTESIFVENRVVTVSKELLATSSVYFTSFFYGKYRKNENGIKSIKEISYDDFVRFIIIITVELCLIALGFGDYFGFMEVVAKTVPYLLANKLPEHLLNRGLELADKLSNNTEILVGISLINAYTEIKDQLGIMLQRHDLTSRKYEDVKFFAVPVSRPTPSTHCYRRHLATRSKRSDISFTSEDRGKTHYINNFILVVQFWFTSECSSIAVNTSQSEGYVRTGFPAHLHVPAPSIFEIKTKCSDVETLHFSQVAEDI
ncbi:hypothetical protein PRIPAC_86917, partial [Pristionchus pacificus]|uniref:BTB domain-containing protein n=1 Tax=Pristionchus pacificus TaxID=54126 RepID=A0A2A6BNK0_PRIPA